LCDEEDAAQQEKRKKNKNKCMPLKCDKVPSNPSIILAAYTIRKLKAGEYCKLHYLTNKGLEDTKAAVLVATLMHS
ncbi:uncharacterized protein BJ212DRAFT_1287109, partial [Suillus subaureus]